MRTNLFPKGHMTITGNVLTVTATEVWLFLEARDAAIHSAAHSTGTADKII